MTRQSGNRMMGGLFMTVGLVAGVGLALYHPEAQGSPGKQILALLFGSVFFLAGWLMATHGTAFGERCKPYVVRVFLLGFAALLLLAPWIPPDGGHKDTMVERIGGAVVAGIMAVILIVFAIKGPRQETDC